jgi:hypothetical protein
VYVTLAVGLPGNGVSGEEAPVEELLGVGRVLARLLGERVEDPVGYAALGKRLGFMV